MKSEWLDLESPAKLAAKRDEPLQAELDALWREAGGMWDEFCDVPAYSGFVAADYALVFQALRRFQGRAASFLEWGSGTGVATIMASMLGFEAYGIEIESRLVETSRQLASAYNSRAQFVEGSFIPDDYDWNAQHGDEHFYSRLDGRSGYVEMDMELRDFDLVYAYPWPEEERLLQDIVRQCGARHALLLTYHVREGMKLSRFGSRRR